ncbi:hypothetical protein K8S19_04880 [bacterium]|nr:hypothetical protein [bacterium]
MKYDDFRQKVQHLPVISGEAMKLLFQENPHTLKNQLQNWIRQKKIIRLRKSVYILNEDDRKMNLSLMAIAMNLYSPAYVSLETALSFYGLIPEKTTAITCITTRKTKTFQNELGRFVFQHVKLEAFSGYRQHQDGNQSAVYSIAMPEKALIDYIYLHREFRLATVDEKIWEENLRLQHVETLDPNKIRGYAALFQRADMRLAAEALCRRMEK